MTKTAEHEFWWAPTEKQTAALERYEFETLYGGARGGGKTDCGMVWIAMDADKSGLRGLVIRRNAKDLSDWVDRAREMYKPLQAEFSGNPAIIKFPSGAVIRTGHLRDENAYEQYQGHEYNRMLIEELTHIPTEESYIKLISSCRTSDDKVPAKVFCTTNPGNAGHLWVKRRFVDVALPGKSYIDSRTKTDRIFIQARVEDNPHLAEKNPQYVSFLDGLPDGLREQWREGSWEEIEVKGAYYAQQLEQIKKDGRICRLPYDRDLHVYTSWDIGVNDQTVIWFFQVYGREIRLIDLLYGEGYGLPHYLKSIKEKEYDIREHFFPHDIANREFGSGKSREEVLIANGIKYSIVPRMSLEDGINAVRMILGRCVFDKDKCDNGIRALRHYRREYDDKRLTYKDKPLHDWSSDYCDSFRYLAISVDKIEPMADRGLESYMYNQVVSNYSSVTGVT